MLKRREKQKLSVRIKQLCWPQMGLRRVLRYFRLRIVRLSHAPEPLARAIACGVAVSFFPVFGLHALMGVALAVLVRANVIAAALATLVIPPFLLPLLFSLDFLVGRKILRFLGFDGHGPESAFVEQATRGPDYVSESFHDLFVPAFVGSAIFMLLVWPATYMAAHKLIALLALRHRQDRDKAGRKKEEHRTMIIGIGEDTCDIRRIQHVLDRHGDRFLARCFTETERAKAARRKGKNEPAATLAKRFAAKEACAKALGTGINRGIAFRDIGVVNAPSGKPTLDLQGPARARLDALTPPGTDARIHVTLGDEFPYARASVIIEALKPEEGANLG